MSSVPLSDAAPDPTLAHPDLPAQGYAIGPIIGVRIAGSSVGDLQQLRFETTWDVVKEIVKLNMWLSLEGQALSDVLFSVIGRCADNRMKPLLVALRRAVFQVKTPSNRVWSDVVRRVLPADLSARLCVWVSELDHVTELDASLVEVLAAEKLAMTTRLRCAIEKRAFRFGLLLGSPTLADVFDEWVDKSPAGPIRGSVLLRLSKYLSRAVAKTSPYASFTFSGLGGWSVAGPPSCPTEDLVWRGVVELDRKVVHGIWSGLARCPELRPRIQLRVNPSVIEADGQLSFLGAAVSEPVIRLTITETLREAVDFVRSHSQPTVGNLQTHLVNTVAPAEPDRCARYVGELLALGLLELCRPFPDQDPDPLSALSEWVATAANTSVADPGRWPDALRQLQADARGYAELTDAQARTRRVRHIHSTLADLLHELAPSPATSVPTKGLIRENAVITHPVVTCGWDQWQPVFDDLNALRSFVGIFNPHLPAQAKAAAFFLDRFSPGAVVSFLEFYREFHVTNRPETAGSDLTADGPRATQEVAGLRRAAVEALYSQADNAAGIMHVDPAALAKIAASWPPSIQPPGSICCYGQQIPGPDVAHLVVNTVRTGYGWGISRIQHLITQTGAPASVPWQPDPGTGNPAVLLAECRAAFASNLSLRPATVPYAIDYPFADSDTSPAAQLSMAELQVSYEQKRDRLVLRERRGVEVRPLPLGMLVEHALPPAWRFLIRIFGEPQTALAPYPQLLDAGWRSPVDGVRQRARLQVGRLVLLRAAWSLPADQLPLRNKGESDAAYLLRVAQWRDHYGIPQQSFVRVFEPTADADQNRSLGKARKPLYLDVTNWFLLTAFERSIARLVHRGAVVMFEEALPALTDAPRYGNHGQRVTEYIFQLSAATTDD